LIDEKSSIFMFCCFAFVFYNKREKKNIFKIEKKKITVYCHREEHHTILTNSDQIRTRL